ncbi:MAG: hypothetical protein ABH934_00085 [Chloroflexota bacterium]
MADEEKKEPEPIEEKLGRLKVKVYELESLVASKEKELASRDRQNSKLEQAIADKDSQITSLKQALAKSEEQDKRLTDSLFQAVSSYRSVIISANPEVPEELISGDSIETIDKSLTRAEKLVSQVRQGLEAEAMQTRFPSGAPVRTPPDLSALSPKDKIKYAMGGVSP